jgi:hypothetical protein
MNPPDCTRCWYHRARVLAALLLTAGCGGEGTEPESGTLVVAINTVGGDLDVDGYLLQINGKDHGPVRLTSLVRLTPWPTGSHTLGLKNLDQNCELSREPGTVTVRAGEITRAEFEVKCYATGIRVWARTGGLDLDPNGYTVQIGAQVLQTFTAWGSATASRLQPGSYLVQVSGLAENCEAVNDLTREVLVTNRDMIELTFDFRCTAVTGIVEATVRTTGLDLDLDGYLVLVGATHAVPIDPNGRARVHQVPAGSHSVTLTSLTPNCSVPAGQNPKSVQVTAGGFTRDTSRIQFDVTCTQAEKIGFVRDDFIQVVFSDGSNPLPLAMSRGAFSWSPDGKGIVYEGRECGWGYPYYDNCYDRGLQISNLDAQTGFALTGGLTDRDPAWSPDGSSIAFSRGGQLLVVSAQGGMPQTLGIPATAAATEPTWSPDGNRLAFTCEIEPGNLDICAVNRDETNFVRLTDTPWPDKEPAWHPDGSRIAFTTNYNSVMSVVHMAPDGTDLKLVIAGSSPDWSPTGDRLVLFRPAFGLGIVNADGTGFRFLISGPTRTPAWRP